MIYTVNELAKLAGVTVRTLHYYDEIGLLKPSTIKKNGYRYYDQKTLLILQQILFFRELEFSLEQITEMMKSKRFNRGEALIEQKKLLEMKQKRLGELIKTIDKTIDSQKGGETMSSDDIFSSFSEEKIEEYKKEAKERWGHTEAYKESVERTKHWTKADYKRVAEEGARFTQTIADLKDKGLSAENPEVQKLITLHYEALRTFYEPNYEMYKGLGQMYVDDKRFGAYYEKFSKGLAIFMRDAMVYFANQRLKS